MPSDLHLSWLITAAEIAPTTPAVTTKVSRIPGTLLLGLLSGSPVCVSNFGSSSKSCSFGGSCTDCSCVLPGSPACGADGFSCPSSASCTPCMPDAGCPGAWLPSSDSGLPASVLRLSSFKSGLPPSPSDGWPPFSGADGSVTSRAASSVTENGSPDGFSSCSSVKGSLPCSSETWSLSSWIPSLIALISLYGSLLAIVLVYHIIV